MIVLSHSDIVGPLFLRKWWAWTCYWCECCWSCPKIWVLS